MAITVNRPVPFQGTDEEKAANRATHNFQGICEGEEYMDFRCLNCDCKPWHAAADYPCGAVVPRETVEADEPTATAFSSWQRPWSR